MTEPVLLPTIEVAIGTTDGPWHRLELVSPTNAPGLGSEDRPLLRGAVGYRYWITKVGMPGGIIETYLGRLLLSNGNPTPPTGSVTIQSGQHRAYLRMADTPERDPVEAGRIDAR